MATNVRNLERVLKYTTFSDVKLRKLKEVERKADEAFDKFKETNKQYLALKKAAQRASHNRYTYERRAEKDFLKERRDLLNMLLTSGVTPQITAKIENFVKKYLHGDS